MRNLGLLILLTCLLLNIQGNDYSLGITTSLISKRLNTSNEHSFSTNAKNRRPLKPNKPTKPHKEHKPEKDNTKKSEEKIQQNKSNHPEVKKQTAGNMDHQVKKGQAPDSVKRVDEGRGPHEKDHIHFDDKSALNDDGSWKHKERTLTQKEKEWIEKNGWDLPEDQSKNKPKTPDNPPTTENCL